MDYGMIGKIEKAKMYAEERADRIKFDSMQVRINGENHAHVVTYDGGQWNCDCGFFSTRNVCSHTMAMERILENMVQMGEGVH
jgi:hypothetical protein